MARVPIEFVDAIIGTGSTPNGAIRNGDWKLIEWHEDGALELYNITQDISEKNNLVGKQPDKVKSCTLNLSPGKRKAEPSCPHRILTSKPDKGTIRKNQNEIHHDPHHPVFGAIGRTARG